MIVNMTPFRAPSADVGSAYEMGFIRALGRPIFAYSNDERPFLDRVIAFCGGTASPSSAGKHEDPDGVDIESFACMTITCSPAASSSPVGASSPRRPERKVGLEFSAPLSSSCR
jgi:nucleoside 2-deoxyribosyltransferase